MEQYQYTNYQLQFGLTKEAFVDLIHNGQISNSGQILSISNIDKMDTEEETKEI